MSWFRRPKRGAEPPYRADDVRAVIEAARPFLLFYRRVDRDMGPLVNRAQLSGTDMTAQRFRHLRDAVAALEGS